MATSDEDPPPLPFQDPAPESGESDDSSPRASAVARLRAALKEATAGQRVLSWTDYATGEQRLIPRVDLSEAYAALRQRGDHLRRRRIISSVVAGLVMASLLTVVSVYFVVSIPLPDAFSLPATTTVYYADGTTVMARLGSQRRVLVDVNQVPVYVR